MDKNLLELARAVRHRPQDEAAAHALTRALNQGTHMPAVAAMIECWASVLATAPKPGLAIATLYCELASGPARESALALARAALDLAPSSIEALTLFEQHAGWAQLDELCDRYRAFLAEAPFHVASPRVRVTLIDRLVEAGRYDETLEHVRVLPPSSALSPQTEDIERACATTPRRQSA